MTTQQLQQIEAETKRQIEQYKREHPNYTAAELVTSTLKIYAKLHGEQYPSEYEVAELISYSRSTIHFHYCRLVRLGRAVRVHNKFWLLY